MELKILYDAILFQCNRINKEVSVWMNDVFDSVPFYVIEAVVIVRAAEMLVHDESVDRAFLIKTHSDLINRKYTK